MGMIIFCQLLRLVDGLGNILVSLNLNYASICFLSLPDVKTQCGIIKVSRNIS